jgi:hypothetical protein
MKKVRYALGAVGLAPVALGILAPATAAAQTIAPSAKTGKTVNLVTSADAGCTGIKHHSTEHSHLVESFWSAENGGFTCIGTIKLRTSLRKYPVFVSIINHSGKAGFCYESGRLNSHNSATFGCHRSFLRPFWVVGYCLYPGTSSIAEQVGYYVS